MITVEKHLAVLNDGFTTNTYIVTDVESGETAVIDPSLPEPELVEKLKGKNVKYMLITHGHSDHTCGAKIVKENIGGTIVIHKEDNMLLHDVIKNEFANSSADFVFPEIDADLFTEDGDEFMIGNTKITVMHTPGHTRGGVCYIFKEDRVMFTGDTLFRLTAGRADFYGGDAREELRSLAKIGELEGDYKVYPGHDESTTLEFERQYNRYMRTRFRRK